MALELESTKQGKQLKHTAFVLINCDLGYEIEILDQLREMGNVIEAHGTFGAYDIVAEVGAESVDSLRNTITWKIRKLDHVRSTLTLKGMDDYYETS